MVVVSRYWQEGTVGHDPLCCHRSIVAVHKGALLSEKGNFICAVHLYQCLKREKKVLQALVRC
jgi:hypothetical protein